MKYIKIVIVLFMVVFCGCKSMPKKNLNTRTGVIAAYFALPEEDVILLKEQGYTDNEMINILVISVGSHLTIDNVLHMKNEGKSFDEICDTVGMLPEDLKNKSDRIEEEVNTTKY